MTTHQKRGSTLPVEKAKEAIKLLEQRILEDFGYSVSLGAELEFVVRSRQPDDSNPLNLPASNFGEDDNFTPQAWRAEYVEPDKLFPDSPYIAYSYKETDSAHPLHKYETVISHRGVEKEFAPDGHSRGNLLARVAEHTAAAILGDYGKAGMPSSGPYAHVPELRDKVSAIYLNPYVPPIDGDERNGITNGLHINISVNKYGKPADPNMHPNIDRAIRTMGLDNLHLLGTDDESMLRYLKRNNYKYTWMKMNYVENAMPSMATNPYYAVLLTLAATYQGIAEYHARAVSEKPAAHQALGLGHTYMSVAPKAEACFQHPDNQLRNVLNHLEPGRGDEFFDIIATHPPGTEYRRAEASNGTVEQGRVIN